MHGRVALVHRSWDVYGLRSMIVETTVGAEEPPFARTVSLLAQELVGVPLLMSTWRVASAFPLAPKRKVS